ncbi:hypothetical protein [Mycobacteroides abscessus]|uniref:hypothetical protein n=1 Tax=Mycobacteroides abscessus TaxID=36809 RepID=UPI0007F955D5|nr:hypothetical protein [Mycobacteroides abscessus]ANO12776.1 hypothetical protein BAB77_01945 [Mycobacteroides abscessus]ARQ63028.1 hypothetical protein CAK77_02125 [Mycobacteroides abscessus subsp. massiliense]MBE5447559.1 hypothetical protein [Mycobacteroides abscessus]MBE5514180.1 hypothetical protein [Mycobacteroides abscessus]MDM2138121.1 hypothetical protein [Mycobacteroides abscessus]
MNPIQSTMASIRSAFSRGDTDPDVVSENLVFYWVWFWTFTGVSVFVNAVHAWIKAPLFFSLLRTTDPETPKQTHILWEAWKTADDAPPVWFVALAVFLGALMPVALAFGSHALAHPRPGVSRAREVGTYVLTGATVVGAFVLSFLAMQDMAMMFLGLTPMQAAILPIAVDIAIVSSLWEIVSRSPKVHTSAAQQKISEAVAEFNAARETDNAALLERVETTLDTVQERFDTSLAAFHDTILGQVRDELGTALETVQERLETFREMVQNQTTPSRPSVSSRPVSRVSGGSSQPERLITAPETLAAELVNRGALTQPQDIIEMVLTASLDGSSTQKIADAVTAQLPSGKSISKSTAHRIMSVARDLDAELVAAEMESETESEPAMAS